MISLTILSPGGTLCSAQVEKVSFPGAKGLFTVYPEHAPLLSSLLPGTIDNVEACVEVLNGGGGKA